MPWTTKPEKHERWEIKFDEKLPILELIVIGVPTGDDAQGIGRMMFAFAQEVKGPWAILSDLREMTIADPNSRRVWVENMKQAVGMGLSRWAVVNSRHTAAIQSKHVSEVAGMDEITRLTFEYDQATAWVRMVKDVPSAKTTTERAKA